MNAPDIVTEINVKNVIKLKTMLPPPSTTFESNRNKVSFFIKSLKIQILSTKIKFCQPYQFEPLISLKFCYIINYNFFEILLCPVFSFLLIIKIISNHSFVHLFSFTL